MKIYVAALSLVIGTMTSTFPAGAQQREDRQPREISRPVPDHQKCKMVKSKVQDRFGRQVSVKKKVCR